MIQKAPHSHPSLPAIPVVEPRVLRNSVLNSDAELKEEEDYAVNSKYDEYEGPCVDAIPIVSEADSTMVLLLSIFLPGWGCMIAAYRSIDGVNDACFC